MMEPTYLEIEQERADNNMLMRRYKKMTSKDKITTFRKLNVGTKILLQTNFHTKENIKVLGEVLSTTTKPYKGQYFVTFQYLKDNILT